MKKIAFLLLFCPMFIFAQTGKTKTVVKNKAVAKVQAAAKGFTLTGKLDGFKDGTEISLMANGENQALAKTKFSKGSFVLKGTLTEPTLCYLVTSETTNNPVQVYVENSKITLAKDPKKPGAYIIKGSKSQDEFDAFLNKFNPTVQTLSSLAGSINGLEEGPQRQSLMTIYNNTMGVLQNQIDSFVIQSHASPIAPFILNATSQFYDDVVLLNTRYNKLDESLKTTASGIQLKALIDSKLAGAVGTMAMDFTQPDTLGNPVSLSSFRGKYVLVDFWASWCGPCRNENPNVVENFKKFSSKNFTILGVSLDRPGQKEKWMQAIHDDGLTWNHVSDLQFWNNTAAQLYKVQGIPFNILVDPTGKIVARNLRGAELGAKLCEYLGCN